MSLFQNLCFGSIKNLEEQNLNTVILLNPKNEDVIEMLARIQNTELRRAALINE